MKGIPHVLKISVEVGGVLLMVLVLVVSINFLRGSNQSSMKPAGAESYPPPLDGTRQVQNTPDLLVSPYPAPEEQSTTPVSTPQKGFVGPACLIEYSRKLSLQLPAGWYGDINANSINIVNYDTNSIVYEHGKPKNVPANGIKIEIYDLDLGSNQSLEKWVSADKAQSKGQDGNALTISENIPYEIGKYKGVAYALTDSAGWNSRVIALEIDTNKGIVVNIFPADSQAFSEALTILATLDASGKFTCSESSYIPIKLQS